ncbi:transposase [Micromonospora chokoriensis]
MAEIGDDRARFADARALKAYAGAAPVTRASGRSISITHRERPACRCRLSLDLRRRYARRSRQAALPAPPQPRATAIPPRYATCSTGSSAACTTASRQNSFTTPAGPSRCSACPRPPPRSDTGRLDAHERRQGLVRLAQPLHRSRLAPDTPAEAGPAAHRRVAR